MHLLFLTHYFPPEVNAPASRTYEHCRIWAKGIKATVITNFPNHPDGKLFPGYKNKLIQKEKMDGIEVIRLLTFITPNEAFLLRTVNYVWFMIAALLYVVFSGLKFDVVIATTPQFFCGLAGKYISLIKKKPFILELRDLWPDSIVAVGALKNKTVIKFLEKMEVRLYQAADKIISVTKSFKADLEKKGIEGEKIEIIYNGADLDLFKELSKISNRDLDNYLNGGLKVGYIGTIGMAHGAEIFIEAAELLKDKDVKFIIVGSGAEREKLEMQIKNRKLENIRIFPLQPKKEIPSIINKLDLFCVHLKRNKLFETVIPSKMFEGMAVKKPVLIGVRGEARTIIEESECGLFFEPENYNDLADKILLYKDNPEKILLHGMNGYNMVIKNFNRGILAEQFLNIIRKTGKN
jgi:glycosyltransferase involved in cell wall biosynthesis